MIVAGVDGDGTLHLWVTVEYRWCPSCRVRAIGEGLKECVMCDAEDWLLVERFVKAQRAWDERRTT